ncbi:gliding motility-associated C-terminal domain-containing protein [Robiginitalea myxolifaciens]|uniref:Gliding motility-associated C-terminal domain-containing protein n=1 Tax=Robiginitalea myxolifaciens TaxID=400055 RepID=A0A1I6FMR2_9FLAO|nr:T9SS type B sorting domain-containing protein [Robiginitalea myxolifaciens]SFR31231.1 gliding motility-associated C-terminal domain-containing protein [Robiginitalea myxolifaciens]
MKRISGLLSVVFLFSVVSRVQAQLEAAIWYFGDEAGLDFRAGDPQLLFNGLVSTAEGCDSYSDEAGNLLFYTDGLTIWNRFNEVMTNGTNLASSPSGAQAAMVVPLPGTEDIYYIFTPDDALAYDNGLQGAGPLGFNYSVIDMSLSGGRGAVVQKNITLLDRASENVSAIWNFVPDFYWVVTHRVDRFYAWKLTAAGLDPNPVVSIVGPSISNPDNFRGCAKISPNGEKLAIAHAVRNPRFESHLYLYDFNADTGVVSNAVALGDERVYYGVEFSPDSSKLYATGGILEATASGLQGGQNTVDITQWDLGASYIEDSEYLVHRYDRKVPGVVSGSIQLAVNRRIYHSYPGGSLSVIRRPNVAGVDCDFREFHVDLGGRLATYGLPPYMQSYFDTEVIIEQFCYGQPTEFRLENANGIQTINWNFGDPASGGANTTTQLEPNHTFTAPGVFEVAYTVNYVNGSQRDFVEFVDIVDVPQPPASVVLTQCDVDGVDDGITLFDLSDAIPLLDGGDPDVTAFFFESFADALANENQITSRGYTNSTPDQVIFARVFDNPECFVIVSVVLSTNFMDTLEIEPLILCEVTEEDGLVSVRREGLEAHVRAQVEEDGALALFETQEDALLRRLPLFKFQVVYLPDAPRETWFRIDEAGSCGQIGKVEVIFVEPPVFDGIEEVEICGESAILEASDVFEEYLWEDGSTERLREVTEPGVYSVEMQLLECTGFQQFRVVEAQGFTIDEVVIDDFKANNTINVLTSGRDEDLEYSLDGGRTFQGNAFFNGIIPGVYELVVRGPCSEDSQEVVVSGLPTFFTPNGDAHNEVWQMEYAEYFESYSLTIFDRYGNLVQVLNPSNPSWDGNRSGNPMPPADYWYHLRFADGREFRGHFTLKR